VYAGNTDFDQILITPVMLSDHMPNRLMDALSHLLHDQTDAQRPHRPLLADQSATRPLLAYEYGSSWSEQRTQTLANIQPRSGVVPLSYDATVDLSILDDQISLAPLATPEISSTSSSRSGSVRTVSQMIQAAVTTAERHPPMSSNAVQKLDLQLDIDVNALFDQWRTEPSAILPQQQEPEKGEKEMGCRPAIARVSSLRRANSVSSGKRVTFNSNALSERNSKQSPTVRRVNSERTNKKKLFGPSLLRPNRLPSRLPDETGDSLSIPKPPTPPPAPPHNSEKEQSENWTNERLEQELQQLLTSSFASFTENEKPFLSSSSLLTNDTNTTKSQPDQH
jgi:hypothetical protein